MGISKATTGAAAAVLAAATYVAHAVTLEEWRWENRAGYVIVEGYLDSTPSIVSAVLHCDDHYLGNDTAPVNASGAFTFRLADRECHGTLRISRLMADGQSIHSRVVPNAPSLEEGGSLGGVTEYSRNHIFTLQVFLNKEGHDAGTPDGVIGPKTIAALEAWCGSDITEACEAKMRGAVKAYFETHGVGDRP